MAFKNVHLIVLLIIKRVRILSTTETITVLKEATSGILEWSICKWKTVTHLHKISDSLRKRGRASERERQTDRQRQADRQTDRDRERESESEREIQTDTDRVRDRESERQRQRERGTHFFPSGICNSENVLKTFLLKDPDEHPRCFI